MVKMKPDCRASALLVLAFALASISFPVSTTAQLRPVIIAEGFQFNVFADPTQVEEFTRAAVAGPTAMAFDWRGRLFIATYSGKILILLDNDDNGVVDQVKTFASGISIPLGLEFHANGDLYATSNFFGGEGRIMRLRDTDGDDVADEITVIVSGLPSQGDHQTDRLKFGPDGLLYFGQGSATDNGVPKPGRPADGPLNSTIMRIDVEAENPQPDIFATGLRNPFGMAFHPVNGELFSTDGGSGEVCQSANCPPDTAPPEEVNWVVEGGNYGFPLCEGTPDAGNPNCNGVRPPIGQFPRHLTPTSLVFYTGPQAGDFENHLLLTLYKNLPNAQNLGGDLRRLKIEGDPQTGFQVVENAFIAQFNPIDPFDGPVETAIDPISGDIYVARYDPVHHFDPNEHHHIIYRIHRTGSDTLPFIGPVFPSSIKAGTENAAITLIGRHLKPGSVIVANGVEIPTNQGADILELVGNLPANLVSQQGPVTIEVKNPDDSRSNQKTIFITSSGNPPGNDPPEVTLIEVFKKRRDRIVASVPVKRKGKKFRLAVIGTNFKEGAELLVNGIALQLDSATQTELIGRFVVGMLAQPGELIVQVRNPDGEVSATFKLVVGGG